MYRYPFDLLTLDVDLRHIVDHIRRRHELVLPSDEYCDKAWKQGTYENLKVDRGRHSNAASVEDGVPGLNLN